MDVLIFDGNSVGIGFLDRSWDSLPARWESYMEFETGYCGDAIHPYELEGKGVTHWMPLPDPPEITGDTGND